MRTTPGVLLVLLVGSVSRAEEPPPRTGAPLTFESSELGELAGTWGEPFRALMVLPGVSHVVSGASLPVVRGAAPSSTAFYLDGVRVPQLQHLWVGPSTLHPELVSGLDFHRGPAPARFGRELGGTVEARLLPPSPDAVRAVASIDLLNVGLLTQVPIASTGTELTLAGRFAYTPWLAASALNGLRSTPGPDLVLGLFDYQARLTQAVGRGSLRLLAFGSSDDAGLSGEGDVVRLGSTFHRVDLRLTHPLGAGEAEAAVTWGRDTLGGNGGGDASRLTVGLEERMLGARVAWRASLSPRLAVETGADVERRLAEVEQRTTFRPGEAGDPERPTLTTSVLQSVARATLAGAYAQATWTTGPWQLTPGLRVDGYFLEPELLPEKRFLLGGNGWGDRSLPGNVKYLGHVYTQDHNALNCTARSVLNISRDSMARFGFSPATRVFEAAGAGSCIITDKWQGIELFLEPGRECLVAEDGLEVAEAVLCLTDEGVRQLGQAARRRVLAEHTYTHRAVQVEQVLGCSSGVGGAARGQVA